MSLSISLLRCPKEEHIEAILRSILLLFTTALFALIGYSTNANSNGLELITDTVLQNSVSVAVSDDDKYLAVLSSRGSLDIRQASTGKLIRRTKITHKNVIPIFTHMYFDSSCCKLVIATSNEDGLILVDTSTGEVSKILADTIKGAQALLSRPRDGRVLVDTMNSSFLIDYKKQAIISKIEFFKYAEGNYYINDDTNTLYTVDPRLAKISIYSLLTGAQTGTVNLGRFEGAFAVSPDGKSLLAGSTNKGKFYVTSLDQVGKQKKAIEVSCKPSAISFGKDTDHFAIACVDGGVKFIRLSNGQILNEELDSKSKITRLRYHPQSGFWIINMIDGYSTVVDDINMRQVTYKGNGFVDFGELSLSGVSHHRVAIPQAAFYIYTLSSDGAVKNISLAAVKFGR